jgi:hemerythrin HHE cation binding domain-containing protein
MGILDKAIAAVTPMASDEARDEAHAKARAASSSGDWLGTLLDHHERIEAAFDAVRSSTDADERLEAQEELALLLTAHSVAEENVLYPALAQVDETHHATMAYTEQSAAKMQLGLLEYLDPMSQAYMDKFEHLRGAVLQHIYQEESTWFIELKDKAQDPDFLTQRYLEEFSRHYDQDESSAPMDGSAVRGRPAERPSAST